MMTHNSVRFFISLAIVSVAAWVGSIVTLPAINSWYVGLDKPFYNPPDWVFGPVWTVLYVLMAISLYLVWSARTDRSRRYAFIAFSTQLVLNVAWSIAFFGAHQPWLAVGLIIALWLAIAVTMAAFWPIKRLATYLLVPYLAWVGFAAGLNISIAMLNPNPTDGIDTYEECEKAPGSVVLESYPTICMTKDKKQFTNPNQMTDLPAQATLSIPEFGAKVPLQAEIADTYYSYDHSTGEAYLTTTTLEEAVKSLKGGCIAGLHGLYVKEEEGELKEQSRVEILCLPPTTQATTKIGAIQEMLRTAIKTATLE